MSSTNIYTPFIPDQYVVYHITYSGNKFPQNYIGSTSLKQIKSGYMGSVSSEKYKSIWNQELKENPHLFHLDIISYHDTRPAATYKELQIQRIFNVVKNPIFINLSYAKLNGYFGMDNAKSNHPIYDKIAITDGIMNRYISKLDSVPTGWRTGRIAITKHRKPRAKNRYPNSIETRLKKSVAKQGKNNPSYQEFFTLIHNRKTYIKAQISLRFPEFKEFY